MGGGSKQSSPEEESWFAANPEFDPRRQQNPSVFESGGGTFRSVYEPKMVHPVINRIESPSATTSNAIFSKGSNLDSKKIYDMEALRRLIELLGKDKVIKPYGSPEGTNPSF